MKLLFLCAALAVPFARKSPLTAELYMQVQNLCRAATGADNGTLPYEELYDAVISKLIADDYRVLRTVKSDDPSFTWLRSVIRTTSIDLFRKSAGRPDWAKLGEHSRMICKLVLNFGYPAEEAQRLLWEHPPHYEISIEEIDRIVLEIQRLGRIKFNPDGSVHVVKQYCEENEMTEIDFADNSPAPDDMIIHNERLQALHLFLMRLTGSDKLLISQFFGLNNDRMTLKEIAIILDSNETTLQKRKDRLIFDFRNWLMTQKVSLDELICRQLARSAS
jgi:RNA polymerase sigma factor (sigma-70 family)